MKCSAFIATSVDGYIADIEGAVDWLQTAGNSDADMGEQADMGFAAYMQSVDCMIMGRKCMETIAAMNLTPEQWPYGDIPIVVLSHTITTPPENLQGKVDMYSGELVDLVGRLRKGGYRHCYIDGGATITAFLNAGLIDTLTITQAPILLGDGIRLFGEVGRHIRLSASKADVFPNDFIQITHRVDYC